MPMGRWLARVSRMLSSIRAVRSRPGASPSCASDIVLIPVCWIHAAVVRPFFSGYGKGRAMRPPWSVLALHREAQLFGGGKVHRLGLEVDGDAIDLAGILEGAEPVQHVLERLAGCAVQRIAVAAAIRAVIGHHVIGADRQARELG